MIWVSDQGAEDRPADRLSRSVYVGEVSTPGLSPSSRAQPQAYLVVQGSTTEPIPVHFHTVDQFQFFAGGSGTVGRHRVKLGTAHYTDALTPYGPLRPGPSGMSYLTLRARHDDGVRYMPQGRDDLRSLLATAPRDAELRRNIAIDVCVERNATGSGDWTILTEHEDGLLVGARALAPGEVAGAAGGTEGAYVIVVEGSALDGSTVHRAGSLLWLGGAEEGVVQAGAVGATLALLRYPQRSEA